MADYNSNYTGEQIDEAIGKALKSTSVIPTTDVENATEFASGLNIDGVDYAIVGIPIAGDGFKLYRHTFTIQSGDAEPVNCCGCCGVSTTLGNAYDIFYSFMINAWVSMKFGDGEPACVTGSRTQQIIFYVRGDGVLTSYPITRDTTLTNYTVQPY